MCRQLSRSGVSDNSIELLRVAQMFGEAGLCGNFGLRYGLLSYSELHGNLSLSHRGEPPKPEPTQDHPAFKFGQKIQPFGDFTSWIALGEVDVLGARLAATINAMLMV